MSPTGFAGIALYYQSFDEAVAFYAAALGVPDFSKGTGTRGWKVGMTWLTLLRGSDGNPTNVEVQLATETPELADALQAAFIQAGASSQPAEDGWMFEAVRLCPVTDPFGVDVLIWAPRN